MSQEGKALEEGHANQMQFPCVHFNICHLAEKIRLFFWARNLKRGRDLNASSLYHFCLQHLARKIKFFFIVGNSKKGKAVQGRGWREIAAYHLYPFSNDSTLRKIHILGFPAYVESQILAPSGWSYVKLQELLLMRDPLRNLLLQIFTHRHGLSQYAK